MKVLSIGNSFSEDAHMWLHLMSGFGKTKIDTVNLFIGGCALQTHYENILNKSEEYDFETNNIEKIKKMSINAALSEDEYDAITIQQASGYSGMPQTYIPYLEEIVKFVREKQPKAKLYFHKTWSYEIDSTHGHFKFYNNDQGEMTRRINDCAEMASKICDLEIIPVGDFIQYLRDNTEMFNYRNGGISLNRDGFHLSYLYGRFAASVVWYKVLTGEMVNPQEFATVHEKFETDKLKVIVKAAENFFEEYCK